MDSPDGTLEAAFVLIDTLGMIWTPIRAQCRGLVGTPAVGTLTGKGGEARQLAHGRPAAHDDHDPRSGR